MLRSGFTPLPLRERGGGEGSLTNRTLQFARQMRTGPTDAERLLWRHLRAHHFAGCKFRRQQPLGPYIVDFVCFSARLIVELDGGQHLASTRDAERDRRLRASGYTVLRFWNDDVLVRTEAVLEEILRALPLSRPLSRKGRGGSSRGATMKVADIRTDGLRATGGRRTVLRFRNGDALSRTAAAFEELLQDLPLFPGPSPARGEGSFCERRP